LLLCSNTNGASETPLAPFGFQLIEGTSPNGKMPLRYSALHGNVIDES
jgi:hypothetical protein